MATKYPYIPQKEWAKRNPEVIKASKRKWRENNPDYHKKYMKSYRKDNNDKMRFYEKQRHYRERNAKGSFTLEEWDNKKALFNYKCANCGISEEELINKTGEGLTVDHIIPLIKNGLNCIDNIQPLCRKCNLKKSIN